MQADVGVLRCFASTVKVPNAISSSLTAPSPRYLQFPIDNNAT